MSRRGRNEVYYLLKAMAELGPNQGEAGRRPMHLPENDPFYHLVGRIASEWAHFEHTLDMCIWALAGLAPEVGACITAQMLGSRNRFLTIAVLVEKAGLSRKFGKRLNQIESKALKYQEKRNRYMHDPWYLEIASDSAGQFKSVPPKTKEFGFVPISEYDMLRDIRGIEEVKLLASNLYIELWIALKPLRGEWPLPLAEAPF